MIIRNFFRHIWDSVKSLKRNFWMTFASVTMVTVILTLVALFSMVLVNTQKVAEGIEKNIRVNTYLSVDSTDSAKTIINTEGQHVTNDNYHKIFDQIKALPHVKSVKFSSKDEQLKKLQSTYSEEWKLYDGDSNPLSDIYIVEVTEPTYVKPVQKKINVMDGVESAEYGGKEADGIFKAANFIKIWGIFGTIILVFIAVFLISNTIRMTIISRQRDIEIMRLVGAKNSYIRGPFFFEGAWVGMLGAIIPSVMIYFLYTYLYAEYNPQFAINGLALYPTKIFLTAVISGLFVIGIFIGALGSVLSMRRYLKF